MWKESADLSRVSAGAGLCGGYDGVCGENAGSARDYGGFRTPEACVVRKGRLKEKEVERLNHKISMIVPGTVVEGRVESLMPYGAFVDLGDGLSGLVHISQISQKRLKKAFRGTDSRGYCAGSCFKYEDNRISLSIKAAAENAEPDELEEKQAEEYSSKEAVGTSLGDLLKGLKL